MNSFFFSKVWIRHQGGKTFLQTINILKLGKKRDKNITTNCD